MICISFDHRQSPATKYTIISRNIYDLSTDSPSSSYTSCPKDRIVLVFLYDKSKFPRIVCFQIKDQIFSANDRILFANDRILKQDRMLYLIVYFTTQSNFYNLSETGQIVMRGQNRLRLRTVLI